MTIPDSAASICERLEDTESLVSALQQGVRDALRIHKLLGHTIVVWQDGAIVRLTPDQIKVDPDPT